MTGELAALSAALLWAFGSVLYAGVGRYVRAVNMNLIKGVFSCSLMLAVLVFGTFFNLSGFDLATIEVISKEAMTLLVISGVIGIGLGDTAYFACLRRIGPQNGLMLESTAPIMASLMALLLFQEYLSFMAWCGIVMTSAGVVLVVKWSRSSFTHVPGLSGVLFGLLAALCQATGIVLSRQALLMGQVEPLASALVRLSAALVIVLIWFGLRGAISYKPATRQSIVDTLKSLHTNRLILKVAAAIFLGTFLGIWLMQTSVKYTSAGITQTLLATSPLFAMLIGRLRGQTQTPLVWLGLLLGFCGIGLLFAR